jgi:type II secretory pathway pseudopilin PulG
LPDDPTGELDKIKEFLEENLDICKWVALSVVVLEVLGLFFATVLRVVSASTQRDYNSDEEYLAARASRQAVGNHQLNQATTPTAPGAPGDTRPPRKDAWSTRMRDKFGVDTAEFSGAQQNAATPGAGAEQQSSWCTIM